MGKMGNSSQIVPFFSDFPPVSCQFHTVFIHLPQCIFGRFPQFSISPHFPPSPPISPHLYPFFSILPPFLHFPHFPSLCGRLANSAVANADA